MTDRSNTAARPLPRGPYSLIRKAPSYCVFVAGQTAIDPATGRLFAGGILEQTRQVISNIASILATEGYELRDVVKTSVFLADLSDFAVMNAAYASLFVQPFPVRTTVQAVLAKGALIEMDVVAAKADG